MDSSTEEVLKIVEGSRFAALQSRNENHSMLAKADIFSLIALPGQKGCSADAHEELKT